MLDPLLLPRFMLLAHAIAATGFAAWYLGAIPRGAPDRRFRPLGFYMMTTMVVCLTGWLSSFQPIVAAWLPWVNIGGTAVATGLMVWAMAVAVQPGDPKDNWPWSLRITLASHLLVTFYAPRLFELTNRDVPQLWISLLSMLILFWLVTSQLKRLRKRGHHVHWSMAVGVLACLGLGWLLVLQVARQGWMRIEDDLVRQATVLSQALGTTPDLNPASGEALRERYDSALESVCYSSPIIGGAFVLWTDGATSRFIGSTFDPNKTPAPRLRPAHIYTRSLNLAGPSVDSHRETGSEKWITVMAPLDRVPGEPGRAAVGFIASSRLIQADLANTMLATESILLLVALVIYVCIAGYLHGLERVWQRDTLLEASAIVAQKLLHANDPREIAVWLVEHLHRSLHLVHTSFYVAENKNKFAGFEMLAHHPGVEAGSKWFPAATLNERWSEGWQAGERLEGNLDQVSEPFPGFVPAHAGKPWIISEPVRFHDKTWGALTLAFPEGSRAIRSEIRSALSSITTTFSFCLVRQERSDHLAAAEERLRTIIDTTPDGFWDVDYISSRHYRSPQWWQILGYEPPAESSMRYHEDYIESEDLLQLQADHQEPLPAGRHFRRRLFRARHVDGSWRWIETNAVEIRSKHGPAERALGFDRDVTDRRQYEERLRSAAETAARANQAKSEFLATMSHELRTPLNSVIGFASILDRSALNPTQRDWVSSMRASAEQLLGLISDVLDFSRIEAGKMDLELAPFELRRAAEQSLEHFSRQATDKHIALHLHFQREARPTWVTGDVLRLRQIITNLVGNAVKFTEEGHVVLRVQSMDDGRWAFAISDTGPGISPAMMPHLFDRFKQLDPSTTRKHGGTGLGLAISRQLARSMRGDIVVSSERDVGSTFTFTVNLPAAIGPSRRFTDRTAQVNRQVAVLHPDENDIESLESSLFKTGCEIVPFKQVTPLIDYIRNSTEPVCVLFPQAFRPAILETARQLRELFSNHHPPLQLIGLQPVPTEPDQTSPFDLEMSAPLRRRDLITAIGFRLAESASPFEVVQTPPSKSETSPVDSANEPLRVLVAEDHPVNREVIGTMLEQLRVSADYAENGEVAIEFLTRRSYDLALIDIQMPIVDGYGVAEWVRSSWHGRWPPPRMVAVTANATRGDRQRCLDAGMDDFMPKPITFTTLSDLISDLNPTGVLNATQPPSMTTSDSSSSPANPASQPGDLLIDWASFESILGFTNAHEEPEVLRRIIATYEQDCTTILDQVADLAPAEHGEARKLLHKLKGSSGSLAFAGAMASIKKLHDPMESPPAEARAELLERIRRETKQCVEAVRARYPMLNVDPS